MPAATTPLLVPDDFAARHIGPADEEVKEMLALLGYGTLDELIDATVPAAIRLKRPLDLPPAQTEHEALDDIRELARKNRLTRSFLGLGFHETITPPVIQRNILENPGWYTAYTPYQAEIAQGRLEALLNFQTVVIDLTGLEIANASLLDEATAAAEAMTLAYAVRGKPGKERFFVSELCHPQTIDVVRTRAHVRGIEVVVGDHRTAALGDETFGVLVQYPATDGAVHDYRELRAASARGWRAGRGRRGSARLVLLTPPGEWGADIVVGNTQRFGVPLGYGGPHAAYLSTRDEFKRQLPGRIIGVSRDADGRPALRMALQTREQHIRREKATSNVCTAQVLLAVMAGMYAVYHGPEGLRRIARNVHRIARAVCRRRATTRLSRGRRRRSSTRCVSSVAAVRRAERVRSPSSPRQRGINVRVLRRRCDHRRARRDAHARRRARPARGVQRRGRRRLRRRLARGEGRPRSSTRRTRARRRS